MSKKEYSINVYADDRGEAKWCGAYRTGVIPRKNELVFLGYINLSLKPLYRVEEIVHVVAGDTKQAKMVCIQMYVQKVEVPVYLETASQVID